MFMCDYVMYNIHKHLKINNYFIGYKNQKNFILKLKIKISKFLN